MSVVPYFITIIFVYQFNDQFESHFGQSDHWPGRIQGGVCAGWESGAGPKTSSL